jgi:DNA ligase-associated metallophosphoesterase
VAKYAKHSLLGQKLVITPDRALFWKQEKTLIVADPHFGKGQKFRELGIPVPFGTTSCDLDRLSRLILEFNPINLLFLGDLTHDKIDSPTELNGLIARWRNRHKTLNLLLARGNHDRRSAGPPAPFEFNQVAKKIQIEPFCFVHKPECNASHYTIAGHLHPAVSMSGRGWLKETLPCFYFGVCHAILPAFGSLTGNQTIRPTATDRIYVIAGDEVL